MKKLLLIIFLITGIAKAQTPVDTLFKRLLNVESSIMKMKSDLKKHHGQYITGVSLGAFGTVVAIIGTLMKDSIKGKDAVIIAGSAMSFIGGIITIDSHKWIGRAGRRPLYEAKE